MLGASHRPGCSFHLSGFPQSHEAVYRCDVVAVWLPTTTNRAGEWCATATPQRLFLCCGAIRENRATGDMTLHDRLIGDGLVPLDSALGRHADPARALPFDDTWVAAATGHRDLLTRPEVIERVVGWLS